MGKEIVYCDVCGARIAGDEFDRGRAIHVDSKNYCFGCKKQAPAPAEVPPLPAVPTVAPKRDMNDSSRIMGGSKVIRASTQTPPPGRKRPPAPRGMASGRVPRPTAAPAHPDKNKKLILVAAAVGIAALVGIVVMMNLKKDKDTGGTNGSSGGGGSTSVDAPLWAELQAFDRQNAGDPAAVLEQFREKRPRCADPEIRAKIDARISELEKLSAAQTSDTEMDRLIKEIVALDPGKEMREIDSAYRMAEEKAKENAAYAPKLEQLKTSLQDRLRKTLPSHFSEVMKKAEEFKAEKKYFDALYEIEGALGTVKTAAKYVPFDTERVELEKRKEELRKLTQ